MIKNSPLQLCTHYSLVTRDWKLLEFGITLKYVCLSVMQLIDCWLSCPKLKKNKITTKFNTFPLTTFHQNHIRHRHSRDDCTRNAKRWCISLLQLEQICRECQLHNYYRASINSPHSTRVSVIQCLRVGKMWKLSDITRKRACRMQSEGIVTGVA